MTHRSLVIAVGTIYGLLSIVAAIAGVSEVGYQPQLLLFAIAGIVLIGSPWLPHQLLWQLVGLVGLHIAALWQGWTQDSFQWSHLVIRGIVSLVIIALALWAEKEQKHHPTAGTNRRHA